MQGQHGIDLHSHKHVVSAGDEADEPPEEDGEPHEFVIDVNSEYLLSLEQSMSHTDDSSARGKEKV